MPKHDWIDFYQEAIFYCSLCPWHWNKAGGFYYIPDSEKTIYTGINGMGPKGQNFEPKCIPNLKHLAKAYQEKKHATQLG